MATRDRKYDRPLFAGPDSLFAKCLAGASMLGALVLIVVFVTPLRERELVTVDEVPKRLAKLLIAEPEPARTPPLVAEAVTLAEPVEAPVEPEVTPEPEATAPEPRPTRRRKPPEAVQRDPRAGKAGRDRAAREVTETLASTTKSVESALTSLSASLAGASDAPESPRRPRRQRRTRSGRSGGQVTAAETAVVSAGSRAATDVALETELVAVESLGSGGGASSPGGSGAGASSGVDVHRSTASLLSVVRRYAAGIQFCYENELKRDQTLRGKIVVSLTVSPEGRIEAVDLVEDTLGSPALGSCALSQIRDWRFPPIDEGRVTFRIPFVFTPPTTVADRD